MSAHDDAIGYEQARRLRATTAAAGIGGGHLWLYYFGLGGDVSEFEGDAYLHHSLLLPRLQRDLLAQAANEILADLAPPQAPTPRTSATTGSPPTATADRGTGAPAPGAPAATTTAPPRQTPARGTRAPGARTST